MSRLDVFAERDPAAPLFATSDPAAIADALQPIGARFERWPVRAVAADVDDAAVLAAYAPEIEALTRTGGWKMVDVLRIAPGHPNPAALRAKYLAEHTHAEDEVRFFVEGAALFTLRADGRVFNLTANAGDLIAVPAGMRHWFDTGAAPGFTVLRLFRNPDGWVARYTGDPIAERFPRFEPLAA